MTPHDAGADGAFALDAPPTDAPLADVPGACSTPADCLMGQAAPGSTVQCCIGGLCAYSEGVNVLPCSDANVQLIQASDYDQSCNADSDCVAVAEGNFCNAGADNCPTAAINMSAYARYKADVAKTNAALCSAVSGCPAYGSPCCMGGTCREQGCSPGAVPGDAAPEAAE